MTLPYELTFSTLRAGYTNVCVADSIYYICNDVYSYSSDDENTIQYYVHMYCISVFECLPTLLLPQPSQAVRQAGNSLVFQSGRAPKCVDFERCPPKAIAFSEFQNCLELNNRVQEDIPLSCRGVFSQKHLFFKQ